MRILITGGAGFIGSNFVRNLLAGNLGDVSNLERLTVLDSLDYAGNMNNLLSVSNDPRFRFIHGDIRDFEMLTSLIPGHDIIIHFAAKSHVDRSIYNPQPFFATNVIGTQALLQAALESQTKTFIHVSTDEVYGSISEGSWTESSPLLPNSPYAASKGSSDLLARSYWRTYDMDIRITRCTNNYGPNQHPEKFIPLLITNLIEGRKIPIYGDGLNIRDWLHVYDHCRAIWMVATKGKSGEIYNIGGGAEYTNIDLARRILTSLDMETSQIEHIQDRKGHDFRYSLDYSKISKEVGYYPSISFDSGIESTISWYKTNKEWWVPLIPA